MTSERLTACGNEESVCAFLRLPPTLASALEAGELKGTVVTRSEGLALTVGGVSYDFQRAPDRFRCLELFDASGRRVGPFGEGERYLTRATPGAKERSAIQQRSEAAKELAKERQTEVIDDAPRPTKRRAAKMSGPSVSAQRPKRSAAPPRKADAAPSPRSPGTGGTRVDVLPPRGGAGSCKGESAYLVVRGCLSARVSELREWLADDPAPTAGPLEMGVFRAAPRRDGSALWETGGSLPEGDPPPLDAAYARFAAPAAAAKAMASAKARTAASASASRPALEGAEGLTVEACPKETAAHIRQTGLPLFLAPSTAPPASETGAPTRAAAAAAAGVSPPADATLEALAAETWGHLSWAASRALTRVAPTVRVPERARAKKQAPLDPRSVDARVSLLAAWTDASEALERCELDLEITCDEPTATAHRAAAYKATAAAAKVVKRRDANADRLLNCHKRHDVTHACAYDPKLAALDLVRRVRAALDVELSLLRTALVADPHKPPTLDVHLIDRHAIFPPSDPAPPRPAP